jgi:hypothetical protein
MPLRVRLTGLLGGAFLETFILHRYDKTFGHHTATLMYVESEARIQPSVQVLCICDSDFSKNRFTRTSATLPYVRV